MGDYAVNYFNAYTANVIYNENMTLLEAIRMYLLDNNIAPQYKQLNCIQDAVNNIANRYAYQMNMMNDQINNNINHGLDERVIRTLMDIQDVNNMLYHAN